MIEHKGNSYVSGISLKMVMDVYQSILPKPPGVTYILEEIITVLDDFSESRLLGVFDELETALHALDLYSKYRSLKMKTGDSLAVRRVRKNSLVMNKAEMARWDCTGEPNKGVSQGRIELSDSLRTHDIEH